MSNPAIIYRVCFCSTAFIKIDLEAASEEAAIAAARELYISGDSQDPRFIVYDGDSFQAAFAEAIGSPAVETRG